MKSRSFQMLWLGQSFANLGDVLYIVAIISILYEHTGSALFLAMLPFLNTFGSFISGLFAPILLNKYRLKSLLVSSQLSKTILLLILSILINLQLINHVSIVLLFIFTIAFLDGWARPAISAMLPRLVKKEEILKANSFVAMVMDTIQLAGWAVGGILVAILNGHNVIWLTLGLFVLSTGMMIGILDETSIEKEEKKKRTFEILKSGWVKIWKQPIFRSIHVQIFIDTMANVVWIAAILYVFVFEVLQTSEAWWGYINTAFFIGLLLGGTVCSIFARQIEKRLRHMLIVSSFAVSIITFLFGFNSISVAALLFAILHGFSQQIKGIAVDTYLQKEASPKDLPVIYSAQSALASLVFGLASLLFGWIAEVYSVIVAFGLSGILLTIAALYIVFVKEHFAKGYDITK